MEETSTKKLIINADDFGYCNNRNAGIVKAFSQGIVSSVSLLVNAASSREALCLANEHRIPMGLHLNLTEGQPIAQGHNTLIGDNGFFRGKMGFRESLKRGQIDINEIKTEILAQVTWFQNNVGRKPTHIDGHQHIHVIPKVAEVLAQLMRENGITKTRNPVEQGFDQCTWIKQPRKDFLLSVIHDSHLAYDIFEKAGISFPAHFIGLSTMGQNMTIERIQDGLSRKHDQPVYGVANVCEFMVHPGFMAIERIGGCGEGPDNFACSPDREHELGLLLSQELNDYLKWEKYHLCSFEDL